MGIHSLECRKLRKKMACKFTKYKSNLTGNYKVKTPKPKMPWKINHNQCSKRKFMVLAVITCPLLDICGDEHNITSLLGNIDRYYRIKWGRWIVCSCTTNQYRPLGSQCLEMFLMPLSLTTAAVEDGPHPILETFLLGLNNFYFFLNKSRVNLNTDSTKTT